MTKKFRDTRTEIDRNRLPDITKSFIDSCIATKRRHVLASRVQNNETVVQLLSDLAEEWKWPDVPEEKVTMWLEH